MSDPLDRREFLGSSLAAAAVIHLSGSLALASESRLAELLALVDPLLRPRNSTLPDSQNALPLLDSATKMLSERPDGDFEIDDCFRADKPDEKRDRLMSAWLDENHKAIALVEQAVARGQLEFPNAPWTKDRLDVGIRLRSLSHLLRLWAQRLLSQGKSSDAATIGQTMSRAFRLFKDGGGVCVDYLIACACEGDAWQLMRLIAQHEKTDTKIVRLMLTQLTAREDSLSGLRSAIRSEYCHYLLPLLIKADGLDTAKTIRILFEYSEGLELFLSRKKYEMRCKKIAQLIEDSPKPYDLVDTVKRSSVRYATMIRDCDQPWLKHKTQPDRIASDELAAWPKQLAFSVLDGQDPHEVTDLELAMSRDKLGRVNNPLGKKLLDSSELDSKAMHRAALSN